jgi:hypothetical protein
MPGTGHETDGPEELTDTLERGISDVEPYAAGPVQVLDTTKAETGSDYEVSASRLVPLGSEDPSLSDVYVPVPVTGHVNVANDGTMSAELAPVDDEATREVQAWARSLIASGSVAGVARTAPQYGPPTRPTHEIAVDPNGRRVLRRVGYSVF